MNVAAHQPSYLPWLGYLAKIASADLFVVMDDLQYEDQNFQNRNRIKVNNGARWLTVPLRRGPQSERICDKRIHHEPNPKENWQRRTWLTLTTHYRRAPFFSRYAEELEPVYGRSWERLVDLDLHLLGLFMRWFEIDRPIVLASTLPLTGARTARIIEVCRAVGADSYLSGRGASRSYLEPDQFARAGLRLKWHTFAHPVYPQRYPELGFIPNLCALDLLFNCGPESRALLSAAGRPEGACHEALV